MPITTGTIAKALWPGVNTFWGQTYPDQDKGMQYKDIFTEEQSQKHREEMQEVTGFSFAKAKGEGEPVQYDTQYSGALTTAYHTAYALGFQVTREEFDDNLYPELSKRRTKALAISMKETKEVVCSNLLNNGFSSSYALGNGQPLVSASQTSLAGTYSNKQSTDAQLSEAALESLMIQIRLTNDNRGKKAHLKARKLVVAPQNQFQADRLTMSTGRIYDGTVVYRNDENAMKRMGVLPDGYMTYDYLTVNSGKGWFVTTNVAEASLTYFNRVSTELSDDSDFETENAKFKAYMRFSVTNGDPRSIFGSQGL